MLNEKENNKGIVIVATGHAAFGRMAYNLCLSIKSVEDFPVAVLHSGNALKHLSDMQKSNFDHIIEMGTEVMAGTCSKLYAYKYSPFDCTLLLDADMLWLPKQKPSDLFKQLDGVTFTGITEGSEDKPHPKYYFWADVSEIKEVYKPEGKLYQWRSEVLYFTREAALIFEDAISIVSNPRLESIKLFAHKPPDELGINIATAIHNVKPHVINWQPSFWHLMNGGVVPDHNMLYMKYWLISFGSNMITGTLKKVYDRLMKAACYKLGVQHVFQIESKRNFLPDRNKM